MGRKRPSDTRLSASPRSKGAPKDRSVTRNKRSKRPVEPESPKPALSVPRRPTRPGFPGKSAIGQILDLLLRITGTRFRFPREATLGLLIKRRMGARKVGDTNAYLAFLERSPDEVMALQREIFLNNFSSFFGDRVRVLKDNLLPSLLAARPAQTPLRMWVPFCATGEEAYALAIGTLEYMQKQRISPRIQIFATDGQAGLIDLARKGIYPPSLEKTISRSRLKDFFERYDGQYKVRKEVRQLCIFGQHELLRDPPYSRIDLISCGGSRFEALPGVTRILHYALQPHGVLMVERPEELGGLSDTFTPRQGHTQIFTKADKKAHWPLNESTDRPSRLPRFWGAQSGDYEPDAAIKREAEGILLDRDDRESVLVNDALEVLHVWGDIGPYEQASKPGKALDLREVMPDALRKELEAALSAARKSRTLVRARPVRAKRSGRQRRIAIEVRPIVGAQGKTYFLVSYDWSARAQRSEQVEVARQRQEIATWREYARSLLDEHTTTSHALRTANKEALSGQTQVFRHQEAADQVRNELFSLNQEMRSLNSELSQRNAELDEANNDLTNLIRSSRIPVVMFTASLKIRTYTPQAAKVLGLIAADIGRTVSEVRHGLSVDELAAHVADVMSSGRPRQMEVKDRKGRWYTMYLQPYVTEVSACDGVVLILIDIHDLKMERVQLESARDIAEAINRSVRESLLVLDEKLRVVDANLSFYETYRTSTEETIGRIFVELQDGAWAIPGLQERLTAGAREGASVEDFEIERSFPGIGTLIVRINARSLRQRSGNSRLILLSIEDITQRRQAEAHKRGEERYRSHTVATFQLVWTTDAEGRLTEVPPQWATAAAREQGIVPGESWLHAVHPDDRTATGELWRAAMASKRPGRMECRVLWNEGGYRWTGVRTAPVLEGDGSVREWIGTHSDIEDRKSAQEALLAANRAKDIFLATLSHELRTPLHAIVGWTSLLRSGKLGPETFGRAIEAVERNARLQSKIIDDLLDLSRIVSGKLQVDKNWVRIPPVIEAAMSAARPSAQARGIALTLRCDPNAGDMLGDAVRLQQIIGNLLSNAIKFTPSDGSIEVALERSDANVEILVTDTGIGIPASALERIFDRFSQVDSSARRHYGGLGLGLSIVRELVEIMGGTVRAESGGEGRGSTFRVRFPVAAAHPVPAPDQPASQAGDTDAQEGLKGVRVLVVDDEVDARAMLSLALKTQGAEVREAASASEALASIAEWRPDVLVSDIAMPGEDGYELVRKIRSMDSPELGGLPALAISGYASPEDKKQALSAGFQMHMAKPVQIMDLAHAIERLAGRPRPSSFSAESRR